MNIQERYESAKEIYAGLGVDVDAAVERLKTVSYTHLTLPTNSLV